MPKQLLSGPLPDQLATIYDMVGERMEQGRYTGAAHYAQEILRVDPDYGDVQALYHQAIAAKQEQTGTLILSLLGAVIAVGLSRWLGFSHDWQSLLFAVVGLVFGFLISTLLWRRLR